MYGDFFEFFLIFLVETPRGWEEERDLFFLYFLYIFLREEEGGPEWGDFGKGKEGRFTFLAGGLCGEGGGRGGRGRGGGRGGGGGGSEKLMPMCVE